MHQPGRRTGNLTTFGEFETIDHFFKPLADHAGALGLRDDAAVLSGTGEDGELILCKDLLIADVHFRSVDPPRLIGQKALRVNLSDLASMGAAPAGYLMGLVFPQDAPPDPAWMQQFVDGLAEDQQRFNLSLLGGDTTRGGDRLVISITCLGHMQTRPAMRRDLARPGQDLWVSGSLGDSAAGLKCLQPPVEKRENSNVDFLIHRYQCPQPRINLGMRLALKPRACMDISDGLIADTRHIASTSSVSIRINAEALPISDQLNAAGGARADIMQFAMTGGDDYELLFTAEPDERETLAQLSADVDVRLTRIGRIETGGGVSVRDRDGQARVIDGFGGWQHF